VALNDPDGELSVIGSLEQHPRTLALHEALTSVLARGRARTPPAPGKHVGVYWLWWNGLTVSDTGLEYSQPPYEVQGLDNYGSGEGLNAQAVSARLFDIVEEYIEAEPDGWTADAQDVLSPDGPEGVYQWDPFRDDAGRWWIKRGAFDGHRQSIALLKWLRHRSTVEYVRTLSPWTFENRMSPLIPPMSEGEALPEGAHYAPFGRVEYDLVSGLLGGAPL
jgi:hypothetical protein